MSEEEVDLIRRMNAAFNARDYESLAEQVAFRDKQEAIDAVEARKRQ